jgi:hypothetical protein
MTFPCDYLVAAVLLTQPADSLVPVQADRHEALRGCLQEVALAWELLDPREVRYVLTRCEDFEADLNLLRRRYSELADAPPASDSLRFPDRAIINELLAFNRAYRQHLDVRQPGEPARWWQLRTVLQETDHLYQVWDTIRDARCEYYYVTVRRQALKRLRDMLGGSAYYSGQLPPHVPAWRFQPIH